jgi:hypothetical protein
VDRKKARGPLKLLADELPPLRRSMLQKLVRLLRLLSLYHETNKMTANNLAVVMGPNVCRPLVMALTTEALAQTQNVTNAVITLIDDYEFILPREPPSADKHLTQVKRESRVFDPLQINVSDESSSVERSPSGSKVSFTNVKEAEDAIDTKLSISLSDIKPDILLVPPKSARSGGRQRGSSAAARNRGFSNALEWLVTSVQEDALDDQIVADEETNLQETLSANISSETMTAAPSLSASGKKRSTKKAKTQVDNSQPTEPFDPSSDAIASGATISQPKKERSKKLKSESSTNSTSETSTSNSEPPSPREKPSLSDSTKSSGSTSSSGKKRSSKSRLTSDPASPRGDSTAQSSADEAQKSPRRKIAPPSREGSLRTEDF